MNPLLAMGLIQGGSALLGKLVNSPDYNVDPAYKIAIKDLIERSRKGMSPEAYEAYLEEGSAGIGNMLTSGKEQMYRTIGRQGGADTSLAPTFIKNLFTEGARQRRGLGLNLAQMNEQVKSQAFNSLIGALGSKSYADINKFYADKSNLPDFGTPGGLFSLYFLNKAMRGNPMDQGQGSSIWNMNL